MAYEAAGEFDTLSRVKRSLIDNASYYLYFGLAALPVLAFLYSMGILAK
jgi:hypothetical protein